MKNLETHFNKLINKIYAFSSFLEGSFYLIQFQSIMWPIISSEDLSYEIAKKVCLIKNHCSTVDLL